MMCATDREYSYISIFEKLGNYNFSIFYVYCFVRKYIAYVHVSTNL